MAQQHYWVVVAARDHAMRGVQDNFVQANHGKAGPLQRMRPGDGVLLYAPKLIYGSHDACQRFIALGTVADEPMYQVGQTADFNPFRRKVVYESIAETPIQPFIDQLSFITDKKHWGYRFRFGCFAIPLPDFELLRSAMTGDQKLLD